jgi:hypothetical protein
MVIKYDIDWEYRTFHIEQIYTMCGSIADVYLGSSEICAGITLFRHICSVNPSVDSNINFNNIEKPLRAFVDEIITTYEKNRCIICMSHRPLPLVFYGRDLFACGCKYETYHEKCIDSHIRNFGTNKCPQCGPAVKVGNLMTLVTLVLGLYMLYTNSSLFALNILTFATASHIKYFVEKMYDFTKATTVLHYFVGLQPLLLTITAYLHTPITTIESITRYSILGMLAFGFIGIIVVVLDNRINRRT